MGYTTSILSSIKGMLWSVYTDVGLKEKHLVCVESKYSTLQGNFVHFWQDEYTNSNWQKISDCKDLGISFQDVMRSPNHWRHLFVDCFSTLKNPVGRGMRPMHCSMSWFQYNGIQVERIKTLFHPSRLSLPLGLLSMLCPRAKARLHTPKKKKKRKKKNMSSCMPVWCLHLPQCLAAAPS